LIFEKHLPQTIKFVDQHPEINMVIDHIAKPCISHSKFDHNWAENIKQLAARENVTCKLSGMVTEVIDGKWDTSLLQPYFDIVLEAFGPDRLMFGSDWPVCLIQSNYTKWVDTIKSFISSLSLFEQSAIMGGNVKRIYLSNK
jgi:L-fuconolactonase